MCELCFCQTQIGSKYKNLWLLTVSHAPFTGKGDSSRFSKRHENPINDNRGTATGSWRGIVSGTNTGCDFMVFSLPYDLNVRFVFTHFLNLQLTTLERRCSWGHRSKKKGHNFFMLCDFSICLGRLCSRKTCSCKCLHPGINPPQIVQKNISDFF